MLILLLWVSTRFLSTVAVVWSNWPFTSSSPKQHLSNHRLATTSRALMQNQSEPRTHWIIHFTFWAIVLPLSCIVYQLHINTITVADNIFSSLSAGLSPPRTTVFFGGKFFSLGCLLMSGWQQSSQSKCSLQTIYTAQCMDSSVSFQLAPTSASHYLTDAELCGVMRSQSLLHFVGTIVKHENMNHSVFCFFFKSFSKH